MPAWAIERDTVYTAMLKVLEGRHPLASVPVTEYTAFVTGLTTMLEAETDSPVQLYVFAPCAVRVAVLPLQSWFAEELIRTGGRL